MAGYVVLAPEGIDLPNADAVLGDPNNPGTTTHYALNAEVPLSRLIPGQYQWLVQQGLIGEELVGAGGGGGGTWGTITGTLSDQTDLNLALGNKQPLDGDLTAIAALAGSSGLLRKTALDTWTLDTSTYLTANQTITLSGDLTGSGTTSISTTLANTAVTAASYGSASSVGTFTVDSKGRLTAAANTSIAIGQSAVTNLVTDLAAKAPLASPTFTGTVTLPTLVGTDTTDSSSSTTGAFKTAGGLGVAKKLYVGTGANIAGGKTTLAASTTSYGSLNIPAGTEPTVPADGDLWSTTSSLYTRINGVTFDVLQGTAASNAMDEPLGIEDAANVTTSVNNGTRVVAVAPVSGSFTYWYKGTKVSVSTPKTVTLDNTTGTWFVYFNDATATLVKSLTPWSIMDHVPVAAIYWDATKGESVIWNERHGIIMDSATHLRLHSIDGTQVVSGFSATGYTLTPVSPTDADNNIEFSEGILADEDLRTTIAATNGTTYRVWYRTGATGAWTWDTTTLPFLHTAAGYVNYNQYTGGSWQKTQLTNGDYVNYYAIATPALTPAEHGIIFIPSQTKFTSLAEAQQENIANLSFGGIPFQEMAALYKVTLRMSSSYTSTGKTRIEALTRIVGSGTSIVASGVNAHSGLSGLTDANAHPASSISVSTASFGGSVLTSSESTVQLALDRLDDYVAPLASPTFTGTVTAATLDLTTAATATAATSYFVETGSDGVIRPKTLANVKTEIVTTAAVNSAAATTVGTVTSGTWSASFGAVSGANLTNLTAGNLTGTIPSTVLGNSTVYIGTTAVALNRGTGALSLTGVNIDGSAASATNATNATNTGITEDTATASAVYPTWVTSNTGNLPHKTTSTKLSFVPSTGILTATGFSGSGANLTGLPAGQLSGTIPSAVLGNSTVYVGTTAIALNRSTASQALTGITSIDGSAATLTTTRTLWGQNFNGSANVTGSLTSVGDITGSGAVTLSSAAASALNLNSGTTGAVTLDSGTTGAVNVGTNANAKTITIGNVTGATAVAINAGSGGTTFTGTVNVATLDLTTAATATAATSYFVETGSDGVVRPKTLANVKAEVVTTAAVNSAAATTVGTISSGTWQGSVISATYIDSAIARLASPTFTGTPAAPTAATDTNTTQIATTAYVIGQGYLKTSTASSTYAPLASPTFTGTVTLPTLVGTDATDSSSSTTGAFKTAGGLGVAKKLYVGTDANVGGNLTVTGNLTINGTTTTVNSTTVTVDDPIITLGGDTAPAADDNKDRGVEFRYHNGSVAKVGYFGFDDSSGKFTFIPDATNTSEVFSGTKGSIDAYFSGSDINAGTVSATYIDSSIARLASPTFTGTPAAPTAAADTNTTQVATTAFVIGQGYLKSSTASSTYAPLASPTFTGTVTAATLDLTTAATATAATSYFVETGSDGVVRPKTLANVKSEIVTTAAVNSAAATTVGTISSGTWQGSVISATYIDSAIARLASPTFTGTVTVPTLDLTTASTAVAATSYFVETGSDGVVRPKALADVKTEIVTTAAVNSAAATTVGTVTSGTWNGSVVAGQYGGTGVANTGKTITLGGNLTTSGAYALTLTLTGATSVTLPTSGTLMALDTTTTQTGNKTFSGQLIVDNTTDSSSTITGSIQTDGGLGVAKNLYVGGKAVTAATTASTAGLILPHGTAPSSPADGDVWTTTNGMYARVNGVTKGPFVGGSTTLVSDTPPAGALAGDVWIESDTGNEYCYIDGYWVEMGNNAAPTVSSGSATPVGSIMPFAGSSSPLGWLLCAGQAVSVTTYSALYAVVGNAYNPNTGQQVDVNGNAAAGGGYFKVPDMRGRTPVGLDNMNGSDAGVLTSANTLGLAVGAEKVTLTSAESGVPAHSHSIDHDHAAFNATSGNQSANHTHTYATAVSYYGNVASASTGWGGDDVALRIPAGESAYQENNGGMTSQSADHTHTTSIDVPAFTGTSGNNATANASSAHNNMQPSLMLNYIIRAVV